MKDGCRGRPTKERREGGAVCDLESREVKMGKEERKRSKRVMGHLGKGGEMGRKVKGERSM